MFLQTIYVKTQNINYREAGYEFSKCYIDDLTSFKLSHISDTNKADVQLCWFSCYTCFVLQSSENNLIAVISSKEGLRFQQLVQKINLYVPR